jgi:hypothetical protein
MADGEHDGMETVPWPAATELWQSQNPISQSI